MPMSKKLKITYAAFDDISFLASRLELVRRLLIYVESNPETDDLMSLIDEQISMCCDIVRDIEDGVHR